MVKRARPPDSGHWSLPGGRVEPGERLSEAAEREVKEETALEVICGPLVGWAERISESHHFVIFDFAVGLVGTAAQVPVAGDDASEVSWVPLGRVGELELASGLEEFLSEHGVIP
jgi:8-oxo-dGTP diphosphatase